MPRDFLSLASELRMLAPELAEHLSAETARTGEPPELLVARRGFLTAVQTDIIHTLLRPNESIPGYELLDVIGHGGMGVVYRARQKTLDRVVAIKTILVSQMSDRSMAARFEQEARAVARLRHPNIIAAIDFGQHDTRLFFVMELVEGEDLEALIERQQGSRLDARVTETLAWGLARQAAAGLAHAAEQGIVHRDIKPANLLLVEPPAGFPLPPGMPLVKIADFGLAFLTSSEAEAHTRLTAANTTVGSPHYIAPEQLGGGQVDARADIYSLGATVFHLLAGRVPFSGMPLRQILTAKLTGEAVRLSSVRDDVSPETDALVAEMMARNTDERIPSYSELLSRIDGLWESLNRVTLAELPLLSSSPTASWSSENDTPHTAIPKTSAPPADETAALHAARRQATPSPSANLLSKRSIGRRTLLTVAGTVVVSGLGWIVLSALRNSRELALARPRLKLGGWSEPLFDGRSLRNWQPRGGTWVLAEDEDGAKVLSGTNGVIARRLLRGDVQPPRPLSHFVLTLAVRLHQAKAVEVHFGLLREAGDNGSRWALRVEQETAWLAARSTDRGSSEPRTTPVPVSATNADQPRVLRIVRDATHWFAFVDEQPIGTLPLAGLPEHAEFRLLAEAGPAWFSDVEVEELAAPNAGGYTPRGHG